jgi:D-glycero-alpha-D-manno-heptose 1-phosphate guanylyltransferase
MKTYKEAIVLAGGFGTRLQSVVKDLPKPMADVNGKPFLTYILDYLIDYNYTKVVLSVGYLHEKIETFFGTQYKSLQIEYAVETEPLGTGGGIAFAMSFCKSNNILVLNGDTLFKADLFSFEQFHARCNSLLSIVLRHVADTSRYGRVNVNDKGQILNFTEKNKASGEGTINGGIYMINREFIQKLTLPQKFSFEKDLMEKYVSTMPFYALESDGYFIDIGIPEDYERAQKEL